MSKQLDGIEQTEYESCPLECTDCGAYPMQAVYDWKMREIVCAKCGYYPEEEYSDPENVAQWELEKETERRKEEDFYNSLGLMGTNTLQAPQCPINPQ